MSEIPYISGTRPPDSAAKPAAKPAAAGGLKSEGDGTNNQTGQQSGRRQSQAAPAETSRTEYREPAVTIAAATAQLRVGDRLNSEVMSIDAEGRPVILTDKAVLALRPDAGLVQGDKIRLNIVSDDRGVRAEMTSVNGNPKDPPIEIRLAIIALHGFDKSKPPEIPAGGSNEATVRTSHKYSPELLQAAAKALEAVEAKAQAADQKAADQRLVDAQKTAEQFKDDRQAQVLPAKNEQPAAKPDSQAKLENVRPQEPATTHLMAGLGSKPRAVTDGKQDAAAPIDEAKPSSRQSATTAETAAPPAKAETPARADASVGQSLEAKPVVPIIPEKTAIARTKSAIVTLQVPVSSGGSEQTVSLKAEMHVVPAPPRQMPQAARLAEVISVSKEEPSAPTAQPDLLVQTDRGTFMAPSSLEAALKPGTLLMLVPGTGRQWPSTTANQSDGMASILARTAPATDDLSSPASGRPAAMSNYLFLGQVALPKAAALDGSYSIPMVPLNNIGDPLKSTNRPEGLPGLLFNPSETPTALGAMRLQIISAVPLIPDEIKTTGLSVVDGQRAVRITTPDGQFAASIPRGVDPTRESAWLVPPSKSQGLASAYPPSMPTESTIRSNPSWSEQVGLLRRTDPIKAGAADRDQALIDRTREVTVTPAGPNKSVDSASVRTARLDSAFDPNSKNPAVMTLNTSAGRLTIDQPKNWPYLPAGSPVSMAVITGSQWPIDWPGLASVTDAGGSILGAVHNLAGISSWPALSAAASILGHHNKDAAQSLTQRSADGGNRLPNSLLFMMNALGGGNPDQWLGNAAVNALANSGKQTLLDQIRAELARMFTAGQDTGGEWRPIFLPLDTNENSSLLALLLKNNPVRDEQPQNRGAEDDEDENDSQRFIVEVAFSVLGPVQLEGHILGRAFDLKVRTHHALPGQMEQDLKHLFSEALTANNYSGKLVFEDVEIFPVDASSYLPPVART